MAGVVEGRGTHRGLIIARTPLPSLPRVVEHDRLGIERVRGRMCLPPTRASTGAQGAGDSRLPSGTPRIRGLLRSPRADNVWHQRHIADASATPRLTPCPRARARAPSRRRSLVRVHRRRRVPTAAFEVSRQRHVPTGNDRPIFRVIVGGNADGHDMLLRPIEKPKLGLAAESTIE